MIQTLFVFLKAIPAKVKWAILGVFGLVLFSVWTTSTIVSARYEMKLANMRVEQEKLKAEAEELKAKAAEVTVEVVTKYVDRIKVVKEKGDTIVKEVPVYVTAQADSQCQLTHGFAEIHDAAVNNEVPKESSKVDEPLSIPLSEVTKIITGNYNTCNEIREQLIGLQEWVNKQQELHNSK